MSEAILENPAVETLAQVTHPKHNGRQPRGLLSLVLCEAWIAYSLYGFAAMLVLYAADHILATGHAALVIGMPTFIHVLRWVFGASSQTALASALTNSYLMGIFLAPVVTGILTDLYFGFRNAFLAGIVFAFIGFICLSSTATFLIALAFLVLGFSLIRAVLPAQLGRLYESDDPRRAEGYQYFTLGLQVTAIIAPLTGGFAQRYYGWDAAFTVIGLGLPLSALSYGLGWKHLPQARDKRARGVKSSLSGREKRALLLIASVMVALAFSSLPNSQMLSAYELWGSVHYAFDFFGYALPVSSLISLDGIVSTITGIMIIALWRVWARYKTVPSEMAKIVIGGFITVAAPLSLSAGSCFEPDPHQVSLWWAVLFHTINDFGFGLSYATGMALIANIAPTAIKTMMISLFPLSAFLSNFIAGRLASHLDTMSSIAFWNMHVVVTLFGALMLAGIYLISQRDVLQDCG